jgi:hypothetical protein
MHCCSNGGFASMMKAYKQPRHERPALRSLSLRFDPIDPRGMLRAG